MNSIASINEALLAENTELRARLEEAEEMLRAIRTGEVDALVVETTAGPKLFTLQGVDAEQNRMRGEMLAQVTDAVIAVDNEDRITFLNAAAERQYAVSGSDVLGLEFNQIVTREWPSLEVEAGMWTALRERGEWRGELMHRTLDGRQLHVEVSVTALRGPDGEPAGVVRTIRDVSERKKLQDEKAESLRLLDTLLARAPVGFVFLDRDLRFVRINERLAEINGFSIEAHLGRTVAEITPTLDATLRQLTDRILATGQPVLDQEFAGETRGTPGVSRIWNESWYPVRDAGGEIIGFGAVVEEITQRKQVETAMRLANNRFDLAVKCSHVVLWQQDLELRFTWLHNPAPGIDGSDAVGKRDVDLLERAEDAAVIMDLKREVIRSGVGVRKEFFPQIQGVGHCFEVLIEPLRDDAGRVTGITGAAIDITDRKQKEIALKDSEVRYRRLFESAKDGILILDAHAATITHANPFIAELLGYSPEEFQGKELWQIGLFQDVEASKRAMQELQEKGYIRYEDLPLETKAGRKINVEFVSNMYREDGDAVIQCNIRDISDRKRLEESLRRHAADLSDADRRKDEFLATLAHELRNPLAPMRTAVELLRMKGPDIPELQWARDVIDRQTQAMTRLIDDLMDVSRINQGKVVLKREQVELAKIVQGAVETSQPLIEEMGHELTVTLPPRPVIVDADMTRLSQVMLNLLNNAAKYTERGGRIDLRADLQGSDIVVSVADTGIGIPADKLPTLFEMFSQVEGALSRSQGGLGIGLCLVKRLVEMHGGSIEAKSGGPGRGSEFVVRLPIVVERTYTRPASHDGDKARSISDLRILVVDDNRDAAESLAMLLTAMGNIVHTAHDGEEAVAAAGNFRPDVVLCDIGLPKLNGYEACRRMKEQAWDKKMILIAVTGWGQVEDRRKSSEAGFGYHMVKPVDLNNLSNLLLGVRKLSHTPTGKSGPLRVLIVDDMRDARLMLSTLLKASGHDVQTASDGRTAISVALDFEPNAVLMDNSMPGMSGLEVAKQMRLEPKLKDAILIALTGHGDEADRQRSFEAGFDHHLVKPADIRVIRELLKNVR